MKDKSKKALSKVLLAYEKSKFTDTWWMSKNQAECDIDYFLAKYNKKTEPKIKDKIVKSVIDKYQQRSDVGIKKYNNTMDRDDLSLDEWLTHLQEELMDATLYIEKLKTESK
jgi:hypothetical protein|tara:strand:- start:573 stop:908 length:336 start_codon:yes stop_codon:yes gene_type:complete